jgi:hypothetical protein
LPRLARYHIPLGTLRDWEQRRAEPDKTALAYLRVIGAEPERAARALGLPAPGFPLASKNYDLARAKPKFLRPPPPRGRQSPPFLQLFEWLVSGETAQGFASP